MKFLKNLVINLGILIVMLLILLGVGELVARTIFSSTSEGLTAIHLQIFEGSDIYGWGHNPGAVDHHGYGNPTPEIKINSLGFRDDEISLQKPENTKRILVLGDSFTFGMGINKEEIFTEALESKLNTESEEVNYEVINMGSIGYTIDNQYLILKEKGMQLNPDAVIVAFFTGNDVTELRRHEWVTNSNGILEKIIDTKHYVDEEHRLRYKGEEEPVSYVLNFIYKRWLILKKKIGWTNPNEPTLTWPAYLEPDDPNGDIRITKFWAQIETVLKTMKEELDAKEIPLIITAIPMDVQTNKKYWNKYSEMYFDDEAYEKSRPQAKLTELTQTYGIDFIDLLPYFREANDAQWLYYKKSDPHWTPQGHELAAKVLKENTSL